MCIAYMHMHILKILHYIKKSTPSIYAYLLEEQPCQIASRSDLKNKALGFLTVSPTKQQEEEQEDE